MQRVLAVMLVAVTGCGRFGFGEASRDGGATDATRAIDAPADALVTGAFTEVTLPAGGNALGIARAPDGTLYGVLANNRVIRSSSNGALWTSCASETNEYLSQIYVDPATSAVYIAGIPALLVSTDGCASWSDTGLGQSATAVGVIGTKVFAGTYNGPFIETAGTWSAPTTPLGTGSIADVQVDPAHGRVFFGGANGLVRSVDTGTTWTAVNSGLPGNGVLFIALDPSNQTRAIVMADDLDQATYQTSNDGTSWTADSVGGFSMAFDPADPSFVAFGSYNYGLTTSTDNGATFGMSDLRSPAMQTSAVNGLVFDTTSGLYAATGRGMFYAADHSLDWREIDTGIAGWSVVSILSAPDGSLYLGTYAGVLRSIDDGMTWTEGSTGIYEDSEITNVVAVPGSPGSIVVGSINGVLRSDDQGQTFAKLYTATAIDTYQIGSTRIANGLLLIGTGAGVVISNASWTTFTFHGLGGSARFVSDVIALDAGATQLVASSDDGIYYSADSGMTFSDISTGLSERNVNAPTLLPDGSLLVATEYDGLYHATTPGATWTASGLQGQSVYSVLVTPNGIVAAAQNGVYASSDNAVTWQPVPGLEQHSPGSLALDANGQLLVGTASAGLYRTPLP